MFCILLFSAIAGLLVLNSTTAEVIAKRCMQRKLDSEGPSIGNGLWRVEWLRDRCCYVTLKGQTSDLNTLRAQCLENSWRCYLGTIANNY